MSPSSSRPSRGATRLRSWAWWCLGVSSLAVLLSLCVAMLSVARLVLSEESWLPADTEWVPNPVPLHGQLPRFELRDMDGALFGTRQLRGRAYVLQFLPEERASSHQHLVTRLSRVERGLEAERIPFRFVVVARPSFARVEGLARVEGEAGGSDRTSWHVLAADTSWEAEVLAMLSAGALVKGDSSQRWSTLLVDQAGGLRGVYDLTESPRVVEALVADARQVSESGPVPALAGLPMDHPHVLGVGCVGERGRY
ncbi:hypothetical protein HUA76_41260 [Myxococcus sp. CA056]|uniref:hypothetical protein n=1 Tax=Myxococcus sp. CA056 TaxID=2741740 RepID=UPI00157A9766|nr:hypothetical protein [Myxococcus sp. CA056]NTX17224.1 hypothetical protein [Myxococcus sp. CA056]